MSSNTYVTNVLTIKGVSDVKALVYSKIKFDIILLQKPNEPLWLTAPFRNVPRPVR